MPTIYIDFASEGAPWDGETNVSIVGSDALRGTDPAIRIDEHELILTTPQMITLHDQLDAWLHGKPMQETGAIENRLMQAIKSVAEDIDDELIAQRLTHGSEKLARMLKSAIRSRGLRFVIKGKDEA